MRAAVVVQARSHFSLPKAAFGLFGAAAKTRKMSTTIRLDADIMDAFKGTGKGWQTRVNAVLREAVQQGRI